MNSNKNSFNSLVTNATDYAYHQPFNDFALCTNSVFSIEIYCCANEFGALSTLYRQEGIFELGFHSKNLYFDAPGFCQFKLLPEELSLEAKKWYYIAITFDLNTITLYVNGLLIKSVDKTGTLSPADVELSIGKNFYGYIRELRISTMCLDETTVKKKFLNPVSSSDGLAAWFDFSGTEIKDKTPNNIPISVKGFSRIINLTPVLSIENNGCISHYIKNPYNMENGYTVSAKIYPRRGNNSVYTIFSNSDDFDTCGFSLFLKKEDGSDDEFRLHCSVRNSTIDLTADTKINANRWTDIALIFDTAEISLFIDGVKDSLSIAISPSNLTGTSQQRIGASFSNDFIDVNSIFNGYIAYVSQFSELKSADTLQIYISDHPFIFESKILSLYSFEGTPLIESISLQSIQTIGNASFIYAENTNDISIEKGINYYFPTKTSDEWNYLDEDGKWKIKLLADIIESFYIGFFDINKSSDNAITPWYQIATALLSRIESVPVISAELTLLGNQVTSSNINIVRAITSLANHGFANDVSVVVTHFAGTFTASVLPVLPAPITAFIGIINANPSYIIGGTFTVGLIMSSIIIVVNKDKNIRPKPTPPAPVPGRQVIVIGINSIEFNHNSDSSNGGINIKKNRALNIIPPEWNNETSSYDNPANVAYIINDIEQSAAYIVLELTLMRADNIETPIQMKLIGTCGDSSLILGAVESDIFSISLDTSITVIIKLTNNIIKTSGINIFDTLWYWTFEPTSITYTGTKFIINTYHKIFTLLNQPFSPWYFAKEKYDNTRINYPWTEALAIGNKWIGDKTIGKESDIAESMTKGLNSLGYFKYDTTSGSSFYSYGYVLRYFKINKFINNYNNKSKNYSLNCSDCATIISSFGNLYGNVLLQIILVNNKFPDSGFKCNQIISIGDLDDHWEVPFPLHGGSFSYHQICVPNAISDIQHASIYDACLKIDSGNFPDGTEHTKKTALLPTGTQFADTTDSIVDIDTETAYTVQVYRERLVANKEICWASKNLIIEWFLSDDTSARFTESIHKNFPVSESFKQLVSHISSSQKCLPDFRIIWDSLSDDTVDIELDTPNNEIKLYHLINEEIDIDIDCFVCKNIKDAHEQLFALYSGIVNPNALTSTHKGINLGDIAFLCNEDIQSYILFCRSNIVVQMMCNTTNKTDLLPLALNIDTQIIDNLNQV
ncbi:hypothetical protein AGMMS49574_15310 [Bacteroidia bacterium]|nr:hypothetical protein AGMMS49574_15310 [Bacteroidia bacterium]